MMDEQTQTGGGGRRAPVIEPGYTFATVTDKISSIVLTRPISNGWLVGFGVFFLITMLLLYAMGYLFVRGIGIYSMPVHAHQAAPREIAPGTVATVREHELRRYLPVTIIAWIGVRSCIRHWRLVSTTSFPSFQSLGRLAVAIAATLRL